MSVKIEIKKAEGHGTCSRCGVLLGSEYRVEPLRLLEFKADNKDLVVSLVCENCYKIIVKKLREMISKDAQKDLFDDLEHGEVSKPAKKVSGRAIAGGGISGPRPAKKGKGK